MSLSKQLYIIISFIFFMIFTGNFIISVKNTKEYLEVESITKAQDTATSLGMTLKSLIHDKNNPEIKSIVSAIANRGFYKEIRVENSYSSISKNDLISNSKDLDNTKWKILNVSVDSKIGKIEKNSSDNEIMKELEVLENDLIENENNSIEEETYNFTPSGRINNNTIEISFTAVNEDGLKVSTSSKIIINNVIAKVERKVKFDYVPAWFIDIVSINLQEQVSQISDGWQTSANVYVSANPGDAYAKLYEQAKGAIIYAFIAFVISMLILFIFVQYLLKPLKNIEKLANNISIGKFDTIKKLPWTSEIKSVAISMNDMSTKIESIITKLNSNLENMTKKLSKDDLTQLPLKQSFDTDMKEMFINKNSGYVFVIKLYELANFAKTHSNSEVNNYIKSFASILENIKLENLQSNAYRFFGSEFALIGKGFSNNDAKKFTELLQKEINQLGDEFNNKDIIHIGATPFNPIGTTPQMLQSANEAYEKATLIGPNSAVIRDKNDLSRDMQAWKELIFDIVDNSTFDINYIGAAYNFKETSKKVLMKEAFTSACDKEDKNIPIGTFISIAEKYGKVIDFDKRVVEKIINNILVNKIDHEISINLALESISDTAFISWLEKTILEHKSIASQLVFSLTAYAVAKDVDKFKFFADEMHQCGAKVIIKRFETKFIPLENIKDFNLDYIRLARDYTCGICNDTSKQSFVESICELAKLLNIKVFAENIEEDDDFETVKDYELYGASR